MNASSTTTMATTTATTNKYQIKENGFLLHDIYKVFAPADLDNMRSYPIPECIRTFTDYAMDTVGFLHHYNDINEIINVVKNVDVLRELSSYGFIFETK